MDQEYVASGKLTNKSDVFSFGVVLLELITGRKNVDKTESSTYYNLVQWVGIAFHQYFYMKNYA